MLLILFIMSSYSLILNQFKQKLGCNQEERYSDYDLNRMLDKLLQTNSGRPQFDRQLSQQLLQNSPKAQGNRIVLRQFINTILRAQQILHRNIRDAQEKLQFSKNIAQNDQKRSYIVQYTNDLDLIAQTFQLPLPQRSREYDQSAYSNKKVHSIHQSHNGSAIFAQSPSERQESTSLKIVIILLLVSILFEFIMMFVRHHFMNCLAYVFVLGIYLLNYFDRSYIRTCLAVLLTSVILDFVWMIVQSGPYWNNDPSHRSSLRGGFLKFIYIMTIILMISKSVIMIILFRFRSNTEQTRKYVKLLNVKFDLDGRPVSSPVYNLLNNTHIVGLPHYSS